jgi:capsular exopolysaccharide synthesis family protein
MNPSSDILQHQHAETLTLPPEDEFNLRELLRKLNRRKTVIVSIFFLVLVIAMLHVSLQTPLYRATAHLMVDPRKARIVPVETLLSSMSTHPYIIESEMDIIRSRPFMERVVDKLELTRDPLFNPDLRPTPKKEALAEARDWIRSFLPPEPVAESEPAAKPEPEIVVDPANRLLEMRKMIAGMLVGGLRTENVQTSYTIRLTFTFTDPQRAADVVNAVADTYLMDQLESKFEATRLANEWLAERLNKLRQEVHVAELAVQKLREQGNLVRARGTTLLEQHIGELNAQLVMARINRAQAEARYQWAKDNLSSDNTLENVLDIMGSPELKDLRTQESSLRRRQIEMSSRYGSRHPEMLKLSSELNEVTNKINKESRRVMEVLTNEVQENKAKEQALLSSLNELKSQTSVSLKAEVELAELERQAEVSRTLYENFLSRFQQTSGQEDLHRPDARVISYADPPGGPSHPNKVRTLTIGAVIGLMLGLMCAFLLELLDRGFRQSEQVEQMTGLSVLGMMPLLRKSKITPADYVVEKPLSHLAEAIRGVRAAIQLSNVDHPPKTLMVASALPAEGKTTFCATLGRVTAMAGTKVLLIDGDLRRPRLAKILGLKPEAWLEEVLAGEKDLQSAIISDSKTGLQVICGKGSTPNATNLLGSQRMKRLIHWATDKYDLIIIDTPPLMGVADAWSLAHAIDGIIFIIRWAETPRETVRAAMRQMELLNLPAKGIVLAQMDIRKQAHYGYGNHGYYYDRYQSYYKE